MPMTTGDVFLLLQRVVSQMRSRRSGDAQETLGRRSGDGRRDAVETRRRRRSLMRPPGGSVRAASVERPTPGVHLTGTCVRGSRDLILGR